MSSDRLKAVHRVRNFFHSRSRSRGSDKVTDGSSKDPSPRKNDGLSSSVPPVSTTLTATITQPDKNKNPDQGSAQTGSDGRQGLDQGAHSISVATPDESSGIAAQDAPSIQNVVISDNNGRVTGQNAPSIPRLTIIEPNNSASNAAQDASPDVDIWKLAYQRLSKEEPTLVKHYEQILTREEAESADSSAQVNTTHPVTHSITRMTRLASKKLAALDDSRLKIRLRSKTFVVKDGVDQILTVVVAAKDFVSGAVASEPHAAIAWAGVCVLLPVSVFLLQSLSLCQYSCSSQCP
jgi:hypothetical protein